MQRSSNIDEPDYGLLLDDMLFPTRRDIPIGLHRAARRG
jgi:2-oxo-hept-3-ene-1,7-dioate hydratase